MSNKSEFNAAKMYPVLTWRDFRPDMDHAFYIELFVCETYLSSPIPKLPWTNVPSAMRV